MPATMRPAVDRTDRERPPTGLQDLVNVAVLLGAFAAAALGASLAHGAFHAKPEAVVASVRGAAPVSGGDRLLAVQPWPGSQR